MKLAVLILLPFIGLSSWVYSQKWKDSLMSARNQYKYGKYAEAFKTYQYVKKVAPKKIDLTAEMAQAAYKSQQYEAAEKMYNQSGGKYAPSIQKAKTYHNLGNSKLKQKKYDEAIQAYRESLRNNPADEETRYNLAKAMKTQKNQQKKQQQQPPPQKPQAPSPNKNHPHLQ
jgi:tetratricopeptide (TPR) repeat protein